MFLKHICVFLLVLASIVNSNAEHSIRLGRRQPSLIDKTDADAVPSSDRRLWSFWDLLFLIGPKLCDQPKPKFGPLRNKWERECVDSSDSSSSGSSSSSNNVNASVSSSSGSSVSNGNSNSGSALSSNSSATGATAFWPLMAVALAVLAAIAVVIVGRRRQAASNNHPLDGSVKGRMGIFSTFADKTMSNTGDVELASTPYTRA